MSMSAWGMHNHVKDSENKERIAHSAFSLLGFLIEDQHFGMYCTVITVRTETLVIY